MTTLGVTLVGVGVAALLGIFGWIWTNAYTKLAEIEKAIVDLKIQMTEIKSGLFNRDQIKEIVRYEVAEALKNSVH